MVAWEEQEEEGGVWGVGVELTRWKMFALQTLDDSIETPRETPLPPPPPVASSGQLPGLRPDLAPRPDTRKCVPNHRQLAHNKLIFLADLPLTSSTVSWPLI